MLKVLITDVQRFSVHDGPGIRTTVFFKGCPLRCAWCQNPETLKFDNELVFTAERCIACGDCAKACKHKAIKFKKKPILVRNKCIACGDCVAVCPSRALELAAKEYGLAELLPTLVADREFYGDSGGVTISGGEPFQQIEFLGELLPALKREGLNIAAETCGQFRWDEVEPLLEFVDLVLFDLKARSSKLHEKLTGKENRLIISNLKRLIDSGKRHEVRLPLIPGQNDSPEELAKIAELLIELGEKEIWLLPYHRLGESKLRKLNAMIQPLGATPHTIEEIRSKAQVFLDMGIAVRTFKFTLSPTGQ